MLSLSSETATRLFGTLALAPDRPLVVAVSGGGDSLLLLLLADLHLGALGRRSDLLAVTVDHGLRPEAAGEAREVADFCHQRGIAHRTVRWEGVKPGAGVSAAAREARHDLLFAAACDAGASAIAVGHTLDDHAETVLMRRERGEGRGLAGIAPATLVEGEVWIVRPLLSERRHAIRDALRDAGIAWIDDPSNQSADSERIRARRVLEASDAGTIRRDVLAVAEGAARDRVAHGEAAAAILRRHAAMDAPGLYRLDPDFVALETPEAALLTLRLLIANAGGNAHLPDETRSQALLARLTGAPLRATLRGAVIDSRRAGIFLHRESRAAWSGRQPAVPGSLWDGRFRIGAGETGEAAFVEALGLARAAALAEGFADAPRALVRAALAAEPAFIGPDHEADDIRPHVADPARARRVAAPWARLMPSFDLAPARALAALMGGEVPVPPWTGHNDA